MTGAGAANPGRPGVLQLACVLSGAAALVYQVLWARIVGLALGNTLAAVSTVLAAFMGGLCLGSLWASRRVDGLTPARLRRLYALLEWGTALAGTLLLLLTSVPLPRMLPLRLALCAVALAVPATLMGATLPCLTALAAPGARHLGSVAGRLYAANTIGAVAGSLATAFVLLPGLGVRLSSLTAALLNAAAGALVLARGGPVRVEPEPRTRGKRKDHAAPPTAQPLVATATLAVLGLSGCAALAHEVAWTRALVLLIGPTAYAFAFIVTAVIAGIAVGGLAGAAWADRARHPAWSLGLVELGAMAASWAVIAAIGRLPLMVAGLVRENADRMTRLMALEFLGVLALLGVPCILFGAAFPLGVRLLSGTHTPGRAVGRLYAANTAGAISGALLAGLYALPQLGLERTLTAAAGIHGLAGAVCLALGRPSVARVAGAAAALLAALLAPRWLASWDRELLAGGAYKYAAYAAPERLEEELRAGELVFYKEGRATTVSVKRLGGTLSLAVDGKIDATSGGDMLTQRMLAHVPLLLHPAPRDVCVIGLGSGVTAGSALAHGVRSVEAVEIEPAVAQAAALFRHVNRDALADPRLRLVIGDGRNHLLLSPTRYDVVISEPSNPWMAGVSALFSRDFFRIVRARLADGGVFCQWAHIYNMDPADLRTIAAGFTDVFPESALFLLNEGDVLLVGALGRFPRPELAVLSQRMLDPSVGSDLAGVGVRTPAGFTSLFALDAEAVRRFAGDAPRHTDDRPRLEFRAARSLHADTARLNWEAIQAARGSTPQPFDSGWAASAVTLVERGRMLEGAESFGWAFETFRAALQREPRRLDAVEGLVRAALRTGAPERAAAELERLAAGTAPAEAHIGLALLEHNRERPQQALAHLQRVIGRDARNLRALLLAAEIQQGLGNVEAAEGLARGALAVAPGDLEAQGLLAAAMLAAGRRDEALSVTEAMLARDPDAARALEVAAVARAQKGDREAARRAFERLAEVDPAGWNHLNNFGVFVLEGRGYAEAARLFERAVDLNPDNATGYRGLGQAAQALGDRRLLARAQAGLARLAARAP